MSDQGTLDRRQSRDFESLVNTRQDRNTLITGGGLWSWNAVTGTLTWSDEIQVYVGGIGLHTIDASSINTMLAAGTVATFSLNRSSAGGATMVGRQIQDASNFTDQDIVFAVRAPDDRVHMRDGTVISHTETKRLGTAEQVTDRVDTLADGRLSPKPYPTAKQKANDVDGATDAAGLIFTSAGATFNTTIPHVGGEPSTLSYLRIDGDGIYKIASVDSNTQLSLTAAATGSLTGKTYEVYDNTIGYVVGSGQLFIHSNGVIKVDGVDYDEVGTVGSTSYEIIPKAGKEPGAAANLEFINLSGGQGPSGDAGIVSMQDAYDAGAGVVGVGGSPLTLDWPAAPDVVLETRVASGAPTSEVTADGKYKVGELWVDDRAGGFYRFYCTAGILQIEHDGTNKGFRINQLAAISPLIPATPAVYLTWAEYSGTFDVTPTAVTIATGIITGVKGAIFMIEDQTIPSQFYIGEINRAAAAGDKAVISYDEISGDIVIDGDFAGGNPGADFAGGEYRLILFYG